jgi:TolA-binding protein
MKPVFWMALVLACLLAAAPQLRAQAPDSGSASGSGQSKPAGNSQNTPATQTPSRVHTQTNTNPFPENESSVPVLPSKNTFELPPGTYEGSESGRINLPSQDIDPVRSPEDQGTAAAGQDSNSSSSLAGMGNLLPSADDNTQSGKRHGKEQEIVPEHHETAAEDLNAGNYYLDNKDWKGALSRFESALVLDPYNPDVYWGLAECQRHLGDYADARTNYLKVMEYDPGSRHAKEARKALKDPEIANAKPAAGGQPSAQAPK